MKKFQKEKKITDLCNLPPCAENLKLHISRVNYVASIYERANRLNMCLDNPVEHGWSEDGKVIWSSNYFPDDITDMLLAEDLSDEDQDDESMSDTESEYDSETEDDC